jgi:two-component system LytT family response regulator
MNQQISCIIIDDEPHAITLLSAILAEIFPRLEITTTCTEWKTGLAALRDKHYDIAFLDISMPGKNGIDLVKLLPSLQSEVIFTTAHPEYALEAFSVFAAAYLLKPINEFDLSAAVDRALSNIRSKKADRPYNASLPASDIIAIPTSKGVEYVSKTEVLYLESLNKCTNIVARDRKVLSSYNIGKFKNLLPFPPFYAVHRSYIVNVFAVRQYLFSGALIMADQAEIPVARDVREDFLSRFPTVNKEASG